MSLAVFSDFSKRCGVSAEDARPQYFSVVEAIKAKEATPERRSLAEASLHDLATPEWSKARVQSQSKREIRHEPYGWIRRAEKQLADHREVHPKASQGKPPSGTSFNPRTLLQYNAVRHFLKAEVVGKTGARDLSNSATNTAVLWKTLQNAKKRSLTKAKQSPIPAEALTQRLGLLVRKASRRSRKQRHWSLNPHRYRGGTNTNKDQRPKQELAWQRNGSRIREPTNRWWRRKLLVWARKLKMFLPRSRFDAAIRQSNLDILQDIAEDAVHSDASLTIATLNIHKNAPHLAAALSNDETSPDESRHIPLFVDVLCISEASHSGSLSKPVPLKLKEWESSGAGPGARVLVRKPALLAELNFRPPPTEKLLDSKGGNAWASTEFRACTVTTHGVKSTVVSVYVPPDALNKPQADIVWGTLARQCASRLEDGVVIIAGDLNMHLEAEAPGARTRVKSRKLAWDEAWSKVCNDHNARLQRISSDTIPTYGETAVIDSIWVLAKVDPDPSKNPHPARPAANAVNTSIADHKLVWASVAGIGIAVDEPLERNIGPKVDYKPIRYDEENKVAFALKLEANLDDPPGTPLTLNSLTDISVRTAKRYLRSTPAKTVLTQAGVRRVARDADMASLLPNAPPRGDDGLRAKRAARGENPNKMLKKQHLQKLPWWTPEITKLQAGMTIARRTLERRIKRIGRTSLSPPDHVKAAQDRRAKNKQLKKVSNLALQLRDAKAAARGRYYDELGRSKSYSDPQHIVDAHKVRRAVQNNGKSTKGCQLPAPAMERTWKKIFEGDRTVPANAKYLEEIKNLVYAEAKTGKYITLSPEHVRTAQKHLGLSKAPGIDESANEVLRLIQEDRLVDVSTVFSRVLNHPKRLLTRKWKTGLIALIPKSEVPKTADFRPIALLSHVIKFLELTVKAYMEDVLDCEDFLGVYQTGFRRNRGTPEASFMLDSISELCHQRGVPFACIFLDIKKAYDSVPADVLLASMHRLAKKFEIPSRLIVFIHQWVQGHSRKLLIPGSDNWLECLVGVPQGSILAPFLFACVMDTLHGHLKGEDGVLGFDRPNRAGPALNPFGPGTAETDLWRVLMYADDSTLFGRSVADLKILLGKVHEWSGLSRLKFHPEKFEVIRLGYNSNTVYNRLPAHSNRGAPYEAIRLKYPNVAEGIVLPVKDEAKHLGLFKSASFSRTPRAGASPSERPSFRVDLQKRFRKVSSDTKAIAFTNKVRFNSCPGKFAQEIQRSVVEGAVYYGCNLVPIDRKDQATMRTLVGNAAKFGIGGPTQMSTTLALKFVGWQEPAVVIATRLLDLACKLRMSPHPQISKLILALLKAPALSLYPHKRVSPWLALIHKAYHEPTHAALPDDVRATHWPASPEEWCKKVGNFSQGQFLKWYREIKKATSKNHQHPILRHAPHNSRACIRFIPNCFVPFARVDSRTPPRRCECCNGQSDVGGLSGAIDNGTHTLLGCSYPPFKAVTGGLFSDEEETLILRAVAGEPQDLNDYIFGREEDLTIEEPPAPAIDASPSERREYATAVEDHKKVQELIHIKSSGNVLDIIARVLRHKWIGLHNFYNFDTLGWVSPKLESQSRFLRARRIARQYSVPLSRIDEVEGRERYHVYRADLYTAYNWLGAICEQLWYAYCRRPSMKSPASRGARGNPKPLDGNGDGFLPLSPAGGGRAPDDDASGAAPGSPGRPTDDDESDEDPPPPPSERCRRDTTKAPPAGGPFPQPHNPKPHRQSTATGAARTQAAPNPPLHRALTPRDPAPPPRRSPRLHTSGDGRPRPPPTPAPLETPGASTAPRHSRFRPSPPPQPIFQSPPTSAPATAPTPPPPPHQPLRPLPAAELAVIEENLFYFDHGQAAGLAIPPAATPPPAAACYALPQATPRRSPRLAATPPPPAIAPETPRRSSRIRRRRIIAQFTQNAPTPSPPRTPRPCPIAAAQARRAARAASAAEDRRKWGTPPVPTKAYLAPEPPT